MTDKIFTAEEIQADINAILEYFKKTHSEMEVQMESMMDAANKKNDGSRMTNLIKRLFKPSPMKLAMMLAVAGGLAIATQAMEEDDDQSR